MIELEEVGPPLTEVRIASFERDQGISLPDPYRRFLLQTNGGMPSPDKDTVDVEGLPGGAADVQVFFRIGGAVESSELTWNRETLCERIPDDRLAIACDSSGSVFCISLQGADRGAVSFCDLQSVAFNYEADPDFYPVAPDFDSFLNKLREFSDEEPTAADNG